MIKLSSCKLSYCNLRRKVGRSPTFPTPGPTNSLGTCCLMRDDCVHDESPCEMIWQSYCDRLMWMFMSSSIIFSKSMQRSMIVSKSCQVVMSLHFCGNLPWIHIFTSFILSARHLAYTDHHDMLGIWLPWIIVNLASPCDSACLWNRNWKWKRNRNFYPNRIFPPFTTIIHQEIDVVEGFTGILCR